jgi:hypothetical protein
MKASLLDSEGVYTRPGTQKASEQRNSQAEFMGFALGEASARKKSRSVAPRFPKVEVAAGPGGRAER